MTRTAALEEALVAEHAAIYAYGPIGVLLDEEEADAARDAEVSHRQRRDALVVLLTERGVVPPASAAAYDLPFAVTDRGEALELAVLVEERVSAVWRAALPEVTQDDRRLVLDSLVDAAVWATRWRVVAGVEPATVPFPGSL